MGILSQYLKRRVELKALRSKSHYIKALDCYLYCNHDMLFAASKRYPEFRLEVIAESGTDSAKHIKMLIHSTICQYREVAETYLGEVVKPITLEQLDYLIALHMDEYEDALQHIVGHLTALKKKVEALNEAQGKK